MRVAVFVAAVPALQQLDARALKELVDGIRADMAGPLQELLVGNEIVQPMGFQIGQAVR
jgi:hypothetical protein